jgi:hypothetical protein
MIYEDLCRSVTCREGGDGCEVADESSFGDARSWWGPYCGQRATIC